MNLFSQIGQGLANAGQNLFANTIFAADPRDQLARLKLEEARRAAGLLPQFVAGLQPTDPGYTPPAIMTGGGGPAASGDIQPMPQGRPPSYSPSDLAAIGAFSNGDYSAAGNLVKPPDPQWAQGTGGAFYNAHGATAPDAQPNRTNVNGTIVDLNDPANTNRTIPTLGPGEEFVYDQNGRIVGTKNMEGHIEALRQQTEATEGTKANIQAGLDIVQVPMPDGTTQSMTRREAAALLGGGGATTTPPQIGPPRPGAPGGLGRSQSPSDKAYQEKTSEAAATRYNNIQEAGRQAADRIAQYQNIGTLFGNMEGGKLGQAGFDIATAMNAIPGFHVDQKTSNAQAGVALANQIALDARSTANGGGMPGNMSNSDREFLVKMAPGWAQSSEGRRRLIAVRIEMEQRNQQIAAAARQWTDRYGRIDAAGAGGRHFDDYLARFAQAPLHSLADLRR